MDMPTVTKGQVFRYVALPQVMPRVRDLVGSGFWHIAYFMALVFRAANILPATHPYLRSRAIGSYGIMNVLGEASGHLVIKTKHIDQLVLFAAILTGVVILFIQFALLAISFLITPATASSGGVPTNIGEFFVRQDVSEDIAFRLLDRVFGVKGMFGSKDADKIGQFHEALHGLFQFYSIGLLVIGVLIACYFVAAVVAETAETGTPFGKRFNHVWAPIRLVVAIGLLIPIGQGLNSAQWITLYAAKFGSNFASNGWSKFNDVLGKDPRALLGDPEKLVGVANAPEMIHIMEFMMIAKTCKIAVEKKVINGRQGGDGAGKIEAYLVKNPAEGEGQPMGDYKQALEYYNKGDITIRFGERDSKTYTAMKGYVYPHCGDLVLQTTNLKEPGAMKMQEEYFKLIHDMWKSGGLYNLDQHAEEFVKSYAQIPNFKSDKPYTPPDGYKSDVTKQLQERVQKAIEDATKAQLGSETWTKEQEKINKWGWGGAGAWYNRVAQINGSLIGAVHAVPRARLYPATMEMVRQKKEQENQFVDDLSKYTPNQANNTRIPLRVGDADIARTLNEVYIYWKNEGLRNDALASHTRLTGNAIVDAINAIFGTRGLFDMCKNADIHPMAQLSNVGKGIVEASIRNLGFSVATGALGGAANLLYNHIGAPLKAASSFFVTVAMVGLVIGFVLFYVLPFLPFLYFFFAVGGWVKGLFEAMVGVPLWALAHLRIDGEGLPGDAAMNGYYLIFEVFLRPILIIFGLLASVAIFSAMVKVLNDIFHLVVSNLSGFNPDSTRSCTSAGGGTAGTTGTTSTTGGPQVGSVEYFRGPIDEFFFTIIYAIIVYMIGMSSFKLIDLIPNNILRWIGHGVSTFGEQAGDQADGLVQRVSMGGSQLGGQMKEAVTEAAGATGGLASALKNSTSSGGQG